MPDSEIVTIASNGLSAGIRPLGAELQYLRDDAGRDLLWDGDPAVWTGRAPLLFPVIGVLRDGTYRLDGATYPMPKHGFARHSVFTLVEQDAGSATFRLAANDDTHAIYPFEFRLDMRFTLANATLTMEATIANEGDRPMPASFGFHPALRWPLPYGHPREAHRIRFARPEPAPIRRIDPDGLLTPVPHDTPVQGDTLPLRDALFVDDAVILDRPESHLLLYGAETGPQLEVAYPAMPMLGLWTKPGAGYICIEPWQGIADPEGFEGDLWSKPGIVTVPAGMSHHLTVSLTLRHGD